MSDNGESSDGREPLPVAQSVLPHDHDEQRDQEPLNDEFDPADTLDDYLDYAQRPEERVARRMPSHDRNAADEKADTETLDVPELLDTLSQVPANDATEKNPEADGRITGQAKSNKTQKEYHQHLVAARFRNAQEYLTYFLPKSGLDTPASGKWFEDDHIAETILHAITKQMGKDRTGISKDHFCAAITVFLEAAHAEFPTAELDGIDANANYAGREGEVANILTRYLQDLGASCFARHIIANLRQEAVRALLLAVISGYRRWDRALPQRQKEAHDQYLLKLARVQARNEARLLEKGYEVRAAARQASQSAKKDVKPRIISSRTPTVKRLRELDNLVTKKKDVLFNIEPRSNPYAQNARDSGDVRMTDAAATNLARTDTLNIFRDGRRSRSRKADKPVPMPPASSMFSPEVLAETSTHLGAINNKRKRHMVDADDLSANVASEELSMELPFRAKRSRSSK